jgi:ABC-type transport system substrate-binding protein
MDSRDNYWIRRLNSGRLSRRRFVGGAAVAGVGAAGLGLVGCGDDDDGAAPTGTRPPGTTPTTAPGAAPTQGTVAQPGGVLRALWLGGNVFDSVDVHRAFGDPTSWLSNWIINKLVKYKNADTGEIEGDLAQSYEAVDAANYVFKLRQNVKWQNTPLTNGRQFTAEDVKWHFERQAQGKLKDGTVTPFRHQTFYAQTTVETPDQFTVRVKLNAPNGTFVDRLAAYFSTIPNRETMESIEAGTEHRTLTEAAMPATGPYTLQQWRANQEIKIKKNPDYFGTAPYLDGWIYPILFEDPNAARLAFEQKQMDYWSSPDPSITKSIIDRNADTMGEVLTGVANTVFLHLNMNQQFKDIRLVKAVNMAFNRRSAIQFFHQGLGQVSGAVTWLQEGYALPPADLVKYPGYKATDAEYQADLAEARQLWSAGGGPALGDVDIKIPDTWLGPWPDTVQFIPNMLNQALGVTQFKSTRTTYNEEIIPNLANGQFPNWFAWTSQVSGPDPRAGMHANFHSSGSTNFQKVNNPALDTLLVNGLVETDLQKAVSVNREAQKILQDNAQYGNVVLYNYITRTAVWNYLHGNYKKAPVRAQGGRPREAGEGWNIFSGHNSALITWIDQRDPSFQGRPNIAL